MRSRPGLWRASFARTDWPLLALKGRRPTRRYALARLAVCDRCGERMYAGTSGYARKSDGKRWRRYVCANVRFSTGLCDQPPIDAERIDAAVVAHLDELFVDFESWRAELAEARDGQRRLAQAALDRTAKEAADLERLLGKVRADYLRQLEADDKSAARVASDAEEELRARAELLDAEVEARRAAVKEVEGPSDDSLLAACNELSRAMRGEGEGDSLADLNARLRDHFEEFRLDSLDDGTVGVMPVLRSVAVPSGSDVTEILRAWREAGEPGPTEEQLAEYERLRREQTSIVSADGAVPAELPPGVPALIWATGRYVMSPPARDLTVTGHNSPSFGTPVFAIQQGIFPNARLASGPLPGGGLRSPSVCSPSHERQAALHRRSGPEDRPADRNRLGHITLRR